MLNCRVISNLETIFGAKPLNITSHHVTLRHTTWQDVPAWEIVSHHVTWRHIVTSRHDGTPLLHPTRQSRLPPLPVDLPPHPLSLVIIVTSSVQENRGLLNLKTEFTPWKAKLVVRYLTPALGCDWSLDTVSSGSGIERRFLQPFLLI